MASTKDGLRTSHVDFVGEPKSSIFSASSEDAQFGAAISTTSKKSGFSMKKTRTASFCAEDPEVIELAIEKLLSEKAQPTRSDHRAEFKEFNYLAIGDKEVQRYCTNDALGLFTLVNPKDPEVREECAPRIGKKNMNFPEARAEGKIKKNYKLDMVIGSGSFSTIQRGLMTESSVAVKCVAFSILQDCGKSDMFDTEMMMAKHLNHRHVVAIRNVVRNQAMVALVMQDHTGGDLFDKLATSALPSGLATRYVWQMVSGISYCHQLNICHRDIRPENYLLSNLTASADLKLVDFSLAKMNREAQLTGRGDPMRTMVGCLPYVAPEVINGRYDKKCDVWSVGVVSFLCCCGQLPIFEEDDNQKFAKRISEGDIMWQHADKVNKSMQSLLRQMLTKDAAARFDAHSISENKWLKQVGNSVPQEDSCCTLS